MSGYAALIAHRAKCGVSLLQLAGKRSVPAGHVPSGPAGAGSGWLPGTGWPRTPFTDSVE